MVRSRSDWPGQGELPAPSSLLSSRWSRDNLLTSHPARLYDGKLIERIDADSLQALLQGLEQPDGPLQVGAARLGVFTWDVACADRAGPFIVQVPVLVDELGTRGRARAEVAWLSVAHARAFAARGLTRFLVTPRDTFILGGNVKVATYGALPEHRPLTFGAGRLRVQLDEGKLSWLVSLGPRLTAELLAELVAAIVYHYEPEQDGGTTIADLSVNDGDFVVRRRPDGTFDLRLMAARRLETGIGRHLLLLYLIQLMAYEDWDIHGNLTGLPVLISNPAVAFEGVVRGLRYRARDLGSSEDQARAQALQWIATFGRSREGHGYRPWTERFLAGDLPLSFGGDPREHWWRLMPLQSKLGLLELRARLDPTSAEARSAPVVRSFVDRLSRDIGRLPDDDPALSPINDLDRDALMALLTEAEPTAGARGALADALLSGWPYRGLDHLLARVPAARPLRRWKSRLSFGRVIPEAEQGTLKSLGPPPADGGPARALANPEVYGGLTIAPSPPALEAATRMFPSFEAFMDAALHDPRWGYYAVGVTIGSAGHFNTNPEDFSPHYGAWMAGWAFRFWRELRARGALSENDEFSLIEFGAGNGRLAHDILKAVASATADAKLDDGERAHWKTFAARLRYRIYETSASLRERQRTLVGDGAVVAEGDARHPGGTLARDFPDGVKGLVLTNEVPDAFGVHKVVLTGEGAAFAALVVPRAEASVRAAVGDTLARRIDEADQRVRAAFEWRGDPEDYYLDAATFAAVMEALATVSPSQRSRLLDALWFRELYVPAASIPALAAHLAAHVTDYATALAAEDAGVVCYVNVHAARFMRELGAALADGFIVTIDYGDTTFALVKGARRADFPFRVYGDWAKDHIPRPNDPYTAPGTQDLTADVNFTELARAGQDAGLHLLHFGPERDVTGEQLPALLRAAAEQPAVAEFLGNPLFKVLVLGSQPSPLFAGPLMTPLSPWAREQDVAKARRGNLARLARALAASLSPPIPAER